MLRTPTAMYIVLRSRGAWWVDFEGKSHGPYRSREDAAVEAGDLARIAAHAGRRSQVQIPDDDGRYRMAWQSGNDEMASLPSRPEVVQLARKLAPSRLGALKIHASVSLSASSPSPIAASRQITAGQPL
jgi:hypothetical protein